MKVIRNSRRLRQPIEEAMPELGEAVSELVMHPHFRELYLEFLVTVHQMIRATVPLMHTALLRCRQLEDTDAVAAGMIAELA